jgi:hypothetical protein
MPNKKKPIDEFRAEVDAKKQHEVDSAMSKARGEVGRYKTRYDDLLADYESFKNQSDWLDTLSREYEPGKPIEAKSKTGTGEGAVVAVASDWHVFEQVRPQEVNDLNSYSPKIAATSVSEFFNGILAWTEIHRNGLKIKTLVLALLGDFVTNMLHEDQKESNAGPVQEEVMFALNMICSGIDLMLAKGGFDEIKVVCCAGNHARDQKEAKRATGVAQHTYEWLMYRFMADHKYIGNETVSFQVANGYHNWLDMYGRQVRFHHGDWVRYMGGVGGLTIPMNKAIKSWNVGKQADFDIFGHWHQTLNPGLFYSNGSILGYSPYALKIKGEFERPQQGLIVVDSKRFITSVNRIYVR